MSALRSAKRFPKHFFQCLTSNVYMSSRHYGKAKWISITIVAPDGSKAKLKGEADTTLLDVVRDNLVMEDYGVCGGTPGCTTCHVIFNPDDYAKLSELPDETEKSLLECALDVTPTSRLGCQVYLEDAMDGMEIKLPKNKRDYRNC